MTKVLKISGLDLYLAATVGKSAKEQERIEKILVSGAQVFTDEDIDRIVKGVLEKVKIKNDIREDRDRSPDYADSLMI